MATCELFFFLLLLPTVPPSPQAKPLTLYKQKEGQNVKVTIVFEANPPPDNTAKWTVPGYKDQMAVGATSVDKNLKSGPIGEGVSRRGWRAIIRTKCGEKRGKKCSILILYFIWERLMSVT